eukprot:COSAG06_NODE_13186_length_1284_cov_2.006751_1_plen_49_part_10
MMAAEGLEPPHQAHRRKLCALMRLTHGLSIPRCALRARRARYDFQYYFL